MDYEVSSSWWASFMFWKWGQDLAGSYYAWKVRRKYGRYIKVKHYQETFKNEIKDVYTN